MIPQQMSRRPERPLVVAGYDESRAAGAAVRWAATEAAALHGELLVVVAWDTEVGAVAGHAGGDWAEHAARAAQELARPFAEPAATVRTEPVWGHPVEALLAAATNARLLVLGTRGHVGGLGALLGSVSRECLRRAAVPVVLLGPEATPGPESRVIVTTVNGRTDGAAVQWAVDRAVSRHRELRLLESWGLHAMAPGLTVGHDYELARTQARDRHRTALADLRSIVAGRTTVSGELVEGRGPDVEYARSNAGDLLVVDWADEEHRPALRYERCPVVIVPGGPPEPTD